MNEAAAALRLRPVAAEAAAVLAQVHATAFDAPWPREVFQELFANPGVLGVAAMSGGEALGLVIARVVWDEAEILTLAVRPQARRSGVAQALMQAASDAAAALGASALWLEVAQDNAAALGLYHRCGFQQAGRRRGYYARGGSRIDALVMRRTLNTAAA